MIKELLKKLNLDEKNVIFYGDDIAKIKNCNNNHSFLIYIN